MSSSRSNFLHWIGMSTRRIGARLRAILRYIPLIGPLAHCSINHHTDAWKEFFLATLFGTMTFWLSALLLLGMTSNSGATYGELLKFTVDQGQLFIFSAGLIGPIILATAEDPERSEKFPGRAWHIAALVVLCVAASGFYALELTSRDPNAAPFFDRSFLYRASLGIAGVVVVMRYLTIVYRKSTLHPDAPKEIKSRVENFSEAFADRHKGD